MMSELSIYICVVSNNAIMSYRHTMSKVYVNSFIIDPTVLGLSPYNPMT